ncbi:MAG: family 43 glycosylhydrolase, partial [Ketobacteraceae bacterium]|nr:family 43 glycosylhydrolase [Ketobacteraceae bacterium]
MNYLKPMTITALLSLAACSQSTHFVGGVVITNAYPVEILETVSGQSLTISPNANGQTSFRFDGIANGDHYEVTITDSYGQNCSITDNAGTYEGFPVFATKIQCEDADGTRWSGNPIIRNQYSADPTLLAHGDYLYLYAGKDETSLFHIEKERCKENCFQEVAQIAGNFEITGIHIYRTRNMVDWEYVGPAIEARDVPWMKQTWASHIIEKDGKFYLYTCSPRTDVITNVAWKSIGSLLSGKGIATGPTASTGVAVSDSPEGPFIDIGEPLIRYDHPGSIDGVMDPAAFIDDDGSAWLFFGGGGEAQYVELGDDMVSVNGEIRDIRGVAGTNPIPGFTEAAYVHKKNGIYYLSYSKS